MILCQIISKCHISDISAKRLVLPGDAMLAIRAPRSQDDRKCFKHMTETGPLGNEGKQAPHGVSTLF